MELIKKIKQAEVEAQEMIEKAKVDAAALVDQGRQKRRRRQEEAEAHRRKAIDAAVEKAGAQAGDEVKGLNAQAEQQRQQLRQGVQDKIPAAVAKVVDYLRKG